MSAPSPSSSIRGRAQNERAPATPGLSHQSAADSSVAQTPRSVAGQQRVIDELETQLVEKREEANRERSKVQQLINDIDNLKDQQRKDKRCIAGMEEEIDDLRAEFERVSQMTTMSEVGLNADDVHGLLIENEDLQKENERLKHDLSDTEKRLAEKGEENENLKHELSDTEERLFEKGEELKEANDGLQHLKNDLHSERLHTEACLVAMQEAGTKAIQEFWKSKKRQWEPELAAEEDQLAGTDEEEGIQASFEQKEQIGSGKQQPQQQQQQEGNMQPEVSPSQPSEVSSQLQAAQPPVSAKAESTTTASDAELGRQAAHMEPSGSTDVAKSLSPPVEQPVMQPAPAVTKDLSPMADTVPPTQTKAKDTAKDPGPKATLENNTPVQNDQAPTKPPTQSPKGQQKPPSKEPQMAPSNAKQAVQTAPPKQMEDKTDPLPTQPPATTPQVWAHTPGKEKTETPKLSCAQVLAAPPPAAPVPFNKYLASAWKPAAQPSQTTAPTEPKIEIQTNAGSGAKPKEGSGKDQEVEPRQIDAAPPEGMKALEPKPEPEKHKPQGKPSKLGSRQRNQAAQNKRGRGGK